MTLIESEQARDAKLTQIYRGPFNFRYAYNRKREDAQPGISGEDYVVSEISSRQIIFSLCDGVGTSFYGNLGSQIVGEVILEWLGNLNIPQLIDTKRAESYSPWQETICSDLRKELNSRTNFATSLIQKKQSSSQNDIIQLSENMRRDDFGTQSNFVSGVIWQRSNQLPNGLILLLWLGNARIRIFNGEKDLTPLTKWGSNPEQLKEVWSSKDGVIGTIYSYITDLDNISSIIAYSDGLESVDGSIVPNLGPADFHAIVEQAQSIKDDDVSFLEIQISTDDSCDYANDIVSVIRSHLISSREGAAEDTQKDLQRLKRDVDVSTKENVNLKQDIARLRSKATLIAISGLFALFLGVVIGIFIGNVFGKEKEGAGAPTDFPILLPTPTIFINTPTATFENNFNAYP